jgi:hypothetical protein
VHLLPRVCLVDPRGTLPQLRRRAGRAAAPARREAREIPGFDQSDLQAMLVTSPILSFTSSAFPVVEGEDSQTNPGIFGKSLAEWLSARLNERDIAAKGPFAEDWGWMVEIADQPHPTGLACSSDDGEKTSWRVYAFVDLGMLGRFRGKNEAVVAANDLFAKVKDIVSKEPSTANVLVDDQPE